MISFLRDKLSDCLRRLISELHRNKYSADRKSVLFLGFHYCTRSFEGSNVTRANVVVAKVIAVRFEPPTLLRRKVYGGSWFALVSSPFSFRSVLRRQSLMKDIV